MRSLKGEWLGIGILCRVFGHWWVKWIDGSEEYDANKRTGEFNYQYRWCHNCLTTVIR
jgi:hypothetical protein